ncbi:MAG: protein kinase [Blastocatellia bacterium]|nr:protein kinase [Blastocatellia bacterium]
MGRSARLASSRAEPGGLDVTPERWAVVKSVFHAVLDAAQSEREALLAERCGSDAELLAEVRAMLASHDGADGFLERGDSGAVTLSIGSGSNDAAWVLECPRCNATWPGGTVMCPDDGEPLEEDPAKLVGRTLDGTYRLEELVGQGGFGMVFRARHELLGDRVAIKILKRELAASPDVVRRFVREGRVARSIHHDNVVAIHDLRSTSSGIVFLVMEYLEGRTLRDELRRNGRLPLGQVIDVVEQIADGLDAAHELGVVHRDLKPENVMLSGEGAELRAKICDLGLAVLVEGSESGTAANLTVPGQHLGSPRYMSPEQWGVLLPEGEPRIDHRTDVYSLGVLAAEAITGTPPFDGEGVWAVRESHLRPERAVSVADVEGASAEVARILEQAMARDREGRFRSAGDFARALREAAETTPDSSHVPLTSAERRHLVPAVALLLVSGVVAFGSVYALWRPWPSSEPTPGTSAAAPVRAKQYADMTETEKLAFVDERARAVSVLLDGREYRFPPDVRQSIKRAVDRYAARIGSTSTTIGREDIDKVLARGRPHAPFLAETFEKEGLPPILGLYLPMIESEFRTDAVSSIGARGMFQMMPSTAAKYGISESELESVERSGPIAARYPREQFEEFSGDRMGIALGLVAYNLGPRDVRTYLAEVVALDDAEAEMRFWAMAGNSGFDSIDNRETPKYVTTFFAAAIVGENPEAFGFSGPAMTKTAGR